MALKARAVLRAVRACDEAAADGDPADEEEGGIDGEDRWNNSF